MRIGIRFLIAIGAVIVFGLVTIYLFNTSMGRVTLMESDGRRTWIVRAEDDTVALRGAEVRPSDALICEVEGPDLRIDHLVDLYTVAGSGMNDEGKMIWIEGERIENPTEGPQARGVFDRDPMGTVFIWCGAPSF
jgi:hypothetical protein